MKYYEIYKKRLNRFGIDFKSRIQSQREKDFENYLLKSVYRVDFNFEDEMQAGSFEPYKQDKTESLHYLLTRTSLNIEPGTVLMIPDKNGEEKPWMVYWLEEIIASGYNRYIMLRMSHYITWTSQDNEECESWGYLYGPGKGVIRDAIKSSGGALYGEATKENFIILPRNKDIKKELYLEIGEDEFKQSFVVTGFDIQSTKGVEYITLDPVMIRPENIEVTDGNVSPDDLFWIKGMED